MEAESFTQENTEIFLFYAYMFNPDFLPRAKAVTFFHERVGRSDVNNGPPPAGAPLLPPPGGRELVILIHLDHYFDWSPQLERDSSSSVSDPPSSSDSSMGAHFSVFHNFSWTSGVIDGRPDVRTPGVHPQEAYRPPANNHRREDLEDDQSGRWDWRHSINAHGCPFDDLPRRDSHHHTRYPCRYRGSGCTHAKSADVAVEDRGHSASRSPIQRRHRQPPRWDDEGWE
jgi:hypothetical protein